ncbi:MAG: PQQ-dependent sugar dehydrogenase [Pseudomonadota bacterium]
MPPPRQIALSRRRVLAGAAVLALRPRPARSADRIAAAGLVLRRELVTDRLEEPVALGFLPRGGVMIAERHGIAEIRPGERVARLSGVPRGFRGRGGGIRALYVPSDLAQKRFIQLAYVDEFALSQARLRLSRLAYDRFSGQLSEERPVWTEDPAMSVATRISGALAGAGDGTLFLALGDRGQRDQAPDPTLAPGKIYRLREDGGAALINPLLGDASQPGIWSFGHANPVALALRPMDASLWCLDSDGDTAWLTRVLAGLRHTIPAEAELEPEEDALPFVRPSYVWEDGLRPGAMRFVVGPQFEAWQGQLLIAGRRGLRLVSFRGDQVSGETAVPGDFGRITDLRFAPDGALWVLASQRRAGLLWRLTPI